MTANISEWGVHYERTEDNYSLANVPASSRRDRAYEVHCRPIKGDGVDDHVALNDWALRTQKYWCGSIDCMHLFVLREGIIIIQDIYRVTMPVCEKTCRSNLARSPTDRAAIAAGALTFWTRAVQVANIF